LLEAGTIMATTDRVATDALIQAQKLKKHFPVTKGLILMKTVGYVQPVDGIDFSIRHGETLGLVGENRGAGRPPPAN
jgi:oligopeptide transport system ATP-binding protein